MIDLARRTGRLARRGVGLAAAQATGARLPYSVTFILTNRCNFHCSYCNIPAATAAEMGESGFRRAIDELADAGMARASFSGGEVLLRPDTARLVAHARRRGLFTSLNSNGWLFEAQVGRLRDHLDMAVFSLDGPEEVHDRARGRSGSFRRVLRSVDAARRHGISVATITVIHRDNLDVLEQVLEVARRHRFWAYFQPAYLDCFGHRSGLHPALPGPVLTEVAHRLGAARARGLPVAASPGFLERLARGPRFGSCAECRAGRYFGTVMADGTVVPCHLVSRDTRYPNGEELGFARAFRSMAHPADGPGCAISPYQEADLIFRRDPRAIAAALRRLVDPRRG